MPTVPRYSRQVREAGIPDVQKKLLPTPQVPGDAGVIDYRPSAQANGAGFGAAVAQVGNAELEHIQQQREIASAGQAAEFRRARGEWELQNIFDPQKGVLTIKGLAAVGVQDRTLKAFDDFAEKQRAVIKDPKAQIDFDNEVFADRQRIALNLGKHEVKEAYDAHKGALLGDIEIQQNLAGKVAGDPVQVSDAMHRIEQSVKELGRLDGLSPDSSEMQASIQTGVSGALRNAIQSVAQTNNVLARNLAMGFEKRLTAADAEALRPLLERGGVEHDGLTGADDVWNRLARPGPDGRIPPLDVLTDAVRDRFKGDAERTKAGLAYIKERHSDFNSGQVRRLEETKANIWRTVLDGTATRQTLTRDPAFLALPAADQNEILSNTGDELYKVQQRVRGDMQWLWAEDEHARSEQRWTWDKQSHAFTLGQQARTLKEQGEEDKTKAGYALYWTLSDPRKLDGMTEDQIVNKVSELTVPLTNDLLKLKRSLVKTEGRVSAGTIDNDLFKELASAAGLPAYADTKDVSDIDKARLGHLRVRVEQVIAAEEDARKRPMTREEKRAVMQAEIDSKVMLNQWFRDSSYPAATLSPEEKAQAYVPYDDIDAGWLDTAKRWAAENKLKPTAWQYQRAFGLRLAGGTRAEIDAILKGQK